uniref:Putative ovule protein n=1 Tax=Solanum chacoense TaxID=4108 RepID=A0A0V0GLF8_SOLCH
MPSSWLYPYTTSLDLFLVIIPCSSILYLKTHLVPITVLSGRLGTRCHTYFVQIDEVHFVWNSPNQHLSRPP